MSKYEPNRYYDANHWSEHGTKTIDGVLKFTLTENQQAAVSQLIRGWYGDIVSDERKDISEELKAKATKATDAKEKQFLLQIAESIQSRGRA